MILEGRQMPRYDIKNELNILDPQKIELYKDNFNKLRLKGQNGKEHPEVRPVMGFPLTDTDQFVALIQMNNGRKGEEIGLIEDVKKLDSKSRKILRKELKREYFMPRILKINRLRENHGIMKFDVETEKGRRQFETRYKEDIRKMPGGRVLIKDADGNRYEIKDYTRMDARSIHLIDSEI